MTRAITSSQVATLEVQDRDLALLKGLFDSRVLTLDHVAALYFEDKREAAKKRVQKLKAAGLIGERPRRASDPSVLFLSAQAIAMLADRGDLDGYPLLSQSALRKRAQVSDLTLKHELDTATVKVALTSAIRKSDRLTVEEFSTWPLLNQFSVKARMIDAPSGADIVVKPDGFLRIRESHEDGKLVEHTFYLEVDRSKESQEILARKATCYLAHYRSGGLAVKHGRNASEYKQFPFRVLLVLPTAERRDNAIRRLLAGTPPINTLVWLTTFDELARDPLGQVWIRPIDYRHATRCTGMDNTQSGHDTVAIKRHSFWTNALS
jgi:hypothetical protein